MQITPTIIFGLALFGFAWAVTRVPDKNSVIRIQRLVSWRTLIGLVAVMAAILIIMNPEFYALGILGDSAFFDLLVLAISCQLQMSGLRVGRGLVAGLSKFRRLVSLRIYVTRCAILLMFADLISVIQKIGHRIIS